MAKRAERILQRRRQISEIDRAQQRVFEESAETERGKKEREKRDLEGGAEKKNRLFWESLGVLQIFEELQCFLPDSSVSFNEDELVLTFGSKYIEARFIPDGFEEEEPIHFLWTEIKIGIKKKFKRYADAGLNINDMVVGRDGSLDEVIAMALSKPMEKDTGPWSVLRPGDLNGIY